MTAKKKTANDIHATIAAMVAEPPLVFRLADLEQDAHIKFTHTTISNWPLLTIGAFFGQANEDAREADQFCGLVDRACRDAIALLETWTGYHEETARLRALQAALDEGGGESLLEHYTQTLLALGVAYGVRLATEGHGQGGAR